MTRLEGKARELIGTIPTNVDVIIEKLRAGIKNDSSKIIEGKILALRADKCSLLKFAEQAEKLAEQLNRSLYAEGFSREKAKEITIEKTIDMCRKSTKYEGVKSVLSSTAFSEPKEVVAKMIVETNKLKQEKAGNTYTNKFGNQNKNYGNGNNNNRQSNGNYQNNRNSNKNGSYNNNNNNNNRQNGSYNGKSNYQNKNGQNNHGNSNNRGNYSQNTDCVVMSVIFRETK